MTNTPTISVVIPCYNMAPFVCETLESVRAESISNLEIVAVDDGSTDGTADLVARDFPEVRLIRSTNQGPSAARNLGTQLSHGRFVKYLDADDLLVPGALLRQVGTLETSGADVAYCAWQRLELRGDRYEPDAIIARQLHNPQLELTSDFWSPLAAYLFRREIVDRVGGFDERLSTVEDVRLVVDCALRGARFAYCPDVAALYRVHTRDSQSTRDPTGMIADILTNALYVERWWLANGELSIAQRRCLVDVLADVARRSFELDRKVFEHTLTALTRLEPGYVPHQPRRMRMLAHLVGYRRAEHLALWYRRSRGVSERARAAAERRSSRPSPAKKSSRDS